MLKLFIICTGLGRIRRGYESFTREVFDVLSLDSSLEITLFKGYGESKQKEIALWNLHRNDRNACRLGKYSGTNSYYIEQATFFLSLLPHISRQKPDVIYFSDNDIGNMLWHWRRLTNQKYKLLFSNGGPLPPEHPIFGHCDRAQQVAPKHFHTAVQAGVLAEKQSIVPYGTHINPELKIISASQREALKNKLGLPVNKPLILAVGTISRSHKRMDYVVREVANLPAPRPYLLLLGYQDSKSAEIIELGNNLLGSENFQAKTVPQEQVSDYYKVADAFVLGSLSEGLARVFLEAMSYGLPCLVHDYSVSRYAFEDEGYYGDFRVEGSLTALISKVLSEGRDESKSIQRHLSAYERFSWDKLHSVYVEMIQNCANS